MGFTARTAASAMMLAAIGLSAGASNAGPAQGQAEQIALIVNGTPLSVDLDGNESSQTLRELLRGGDITISMHDYGDMEKVGPLPCALPRRDEQITATPGDVMLYQGSHLVIFHGTNRYAYTRIGRVRDATRESMRAALGAGAVTATLSQDKARAARTGQETGR